MTILSLACLAAAIVPLQKELIEATNDALADFDPYDSGNAPGVSVAVVRNGEIVYEHALGLASIEFGVRIGPETVFQIGELSMQFTACCAAILSLRGELDLEADIRTFLPELFDYGPNVVRISHLIHHTSGIRDHVALRELVSSGEPGSIQDTLDLISRQRGLLFEPGKRYEFSRSNYVLLGEIVRRVSGSPLDGFAKEELFGPLGMADTSFVTLRDEVVPNLARSYSRRDDGEHAAIDSPLCSIGDVGMASSARDLAKWERFLCAPDSEAGRHLVDLLRSSEEFSAGVDEAYGFGIGLVRIWGERREQHGGNAGGHRAGIMRLLDRGLTAIVLTNHPRPSPRGLCERVLALWTEDPKALELRPRLVRKSVGCGPNRHLAGPETLAAATGVFWSDELGVYARSSDQDGRLSMCVANHRAVDLPGGSRGIFGFNTQTSSTAIDLAGIEFRYGGRDTYCFEDTSAGLYSTMIWSTCDLGEFAFERLQ